MSGHRVARVASLIHAEMARMLLREVSDPVLSEMRISRVKVTPDLKMVTLYFDDSNLNQKEVRRAFERATPFLRRGLGKLNLRFVPALRLEVEKDVDQADRVIRLLEQMERKHEGSPSHL